MSNDTVSHAVTTASKLIDTLTHKVIMQDISKEVGGKVQHSAPLMIWGQPGVGKSQIVRAVGEATGRNVIDIRLLLKDPTDISGLPYYNESTGTMEYALSPEFPTNPDANDIILLDELSSAPPSVQVAALQLVLERYIGTYKLPDNVFIVAAGNRSKDGTVHSPMPTPLRNRLEHVELQVHADSWLEWAAKRGIHTSVISFIKANPQELNAFDPKEKQRYAFATPRSWEFVSKEIRNTEALRQRGYNRTDHQMFDSIIGLVGADVVSRFREHYREAIDLPDPYEVVKGNIKQVNIEKMGLRYACCLNLAFALREMTQDEQTSEKDKEKYIDNALSFLINKNNIKEKDLIISTFQLLVSEQYQIDIVNSSVVDELLDDEEFENFFSAI